MYTVKVSFHGSYIKCTPQKPLIYIKFSAAPYVTFLKNLNTQQTFQRSFNVVFWLTRRRNVGQRQINIETTLCISTLKFTTSNNVESTLRILTLTWTTLDNVKTTLWKWPLLKRTKNINSSRIPGIQSFNYYFIIFTCSPC